MRRGHLVPLRVSVPRFLGAIEFAGDEGLGLQVWDHEGESSGVYAVSEGRAIVPALEEGLYSVALCEDRRCERAVTRIEDLRVEAGRFTKIP